MTQVGGSARIGVDAILPPLLDFSEVAGGWRVTGALPSSNGTWVEVDDFYAGDGLNAFYFFFIEVEEGQVLATEAEVGHDGLPGVPTIEAPPAAEVGVWAVATARLFAPYFDSN